MKRLAALPLGCALVAGALAACAPADGDASQAALEAATAYVDLVATGAGADREALWRTTATDDPAALRIAGDLLVGAAERIEVLTIGPVEAAPGASTPSIAGGAWLWDEIRQVPVRYRLQGTEYEAVVRLAPTEGADLDDPAAWVVVEPLVGGLAVAPAPLLGVAAGTFISGAEVMVNTTPVLYPAVYEMDQRLDPYLAARQVLQVPVAAGELTQPPAFQLLGTPAAVEAITPAVLELFATCEAPQGECPALDVAQARGVDPWAAPSWWAGILTEPTIVLGEGALTATGGVFAYRDATGGTVEVPFEGTGQWAVSEGEPVVWNFSITQVDS